MFSTQIAEAIDGTKSLLALEELSRAIWQGFSAGALSEPDAQRLAENLEGRRTALRGSSAGVFKNGAPRSIFPLKRLSPTNYDRRKSIERRRRLAASGPLPPNLAQNFTTGEMAILRIIADEFRENGYCDKSISEISARAGVCRRTAQNAICQARRLGLISVEERRRPGRANLPNLIRIISREWLMWLARGAKSGFRLSARGGCKKVHPTEIRGFQERKKRAETPPENTIHLQLEDSATT